jgi:anthranilate synthase component 1
VSVPADSGAVRGRDLVREALYAPVADEFDDAVASGARRIPVLRELGADLVTPLGAYLALTARGASHAVLLESVEGGERQASTSVVAANPRAVATFRDGRGELHHRDGRVEALASADPLDLVDRECGEELRLDPRYGFPRFLGGVIGTMSYECAALWEDLPIAAGSGLGLPDGVLLVCDELVVFDHLRHRLLCVAVARPDEHGGDARAAHADAMARVDELVAAVTRGPEVAAASAGPTLVERRCAVAEEVAGKRAPDPASTLGAEAYAAAVRSLQEQIVAGEIIQAVPSQRFSRATCASAVELYRALRTVGPAPYMYLLQLGDHALVGASPELLVQVAGRDVSTHPIAGTRPRGATVAEDLELEAELLADPKERAEHVMLVDLGRNDLGRVCEPGSVRVPELLQVERFSHVMHICSHVTGTLRAGLRASDAVRACFPAGTVSGAPKLRAIELVAALEPDRRGPYAGLVGCFAGSGDVDAAIAIRTIALVDGVAHVQAGAGVVAASDPAAEHRETEAKARALLRAVDIAEAQAGARRGGAA